MSKFLYSFLVLVALLYSFAASPLHADSSAGKSWALYTWTDDDGRWNYSLVRNTEKHPDAAEVKAAGTHSLEGIKTRISLLHDASTLEINPLPVLNMEMHLPPSNTIKEFERVCNSSKMRLIQ